jgi:DNA polymerase-3 subunit chi
MTDILFYHLQRQPLEKVLPQLLEKTLDRGWKAVIQASSAERASALDLQLWTYADESFLPHALESDADPETDAIVITASDANKNGASVRFLVDSAPFPQDVAGYQRIVVMFDGNDDEAMAAARVQFKTAREQGHAVTYWQQDETGRWEKKA